MMGCSDANIYSKNQRQAVLSKVESVIQAWTAKWFGKQILQVEGHFNEVLFGSALMPSYGPFEVIDGESAGLLVSEGNELEAWFATALGEENKFSKEVKREYLKRVFNDLNTLLGLPKEPQPQLACAVEVSLMGQKLVIHCGTQWVRGLVAKPTSAPCCGVLAALDKEAVDLETKLSVSSVSLKEIASLTPGDVLPLDQVVSSPLTLSVKGKSQIARGYLVAMNGMKSFLVESGN